MRLCIQTATDISLTSVRRSAGLAAAMIGSPVPRHRARRIINFIDHLTAGEDQAMEPRKGSIPCTPSRTRSSRPTMGASAVTSVTSPKSVTHMSLPSKQQFNGT